MDYENLYNLLEYCKKNNINLTSRILKFIKKQNNIKEIEFPIFKYPFDIIKFYFDNRVEVIRTYLLKPKTYSEDLNTILDTCNELLLALEEEPIAITSSKEDDIKDKIAKSLIILKRDSHALRDLGFNYFALGSYELASIYFEELLYLVKNNDTEVTCYLFICYIYLIDKLNVAKILPNILASSENLNTKVIYLLKEALLFLIANNVNDLAISITELVLNYDLDKEFLKKCLILADDNFNYELAGFYASILSKNDPTYLKIHNYLISRALINLEEIPENIQLVVNEILSSKKDIKEIISEFNLTK